MDHECNILVDKEGQTVVTFGIIKIELPAVKESFNGRISLSTSIWAASILLCRHLFKNKEMLLGKRILEVFGF
jgi:hypothetical protein